MAPAPQRFAWLSGALVIASVLLVARILSPDPHGFGTHTQLGLPACWLLRTTGLPCPACGLTTCFVLMAHGAFAAGVACHPIGAVLFVLACASLVACVYAAMRGSAWHEAWMRLRAPRLCALLACALLTQWIVRIAGLLFD